MKGKAKFIMWGAAILLFGALIIFSSGNINSSPKIAWVELGQLYESFEMKQELEAQIKKVTTARKGLIDSLEFDLQVLERQIKAGPKNDQEKISQYQVKYENYRKKKQEFEEDNQAMIKEYDKQITTQVNQYLKDFGKEHGYKYILGANGSGSMMYADEEENITEQVKEFINNKYKGIEQ